MKVIKYKGKEVLIVKVGNKEYAVQNRCPHMQGDLSKGKLTGKILRCPLHGAEYDVTTGKGIKGPKMLFMTMKPRDLETFDVKKIK